MTAVPERPIKPGAPADGRAPEIRDRDEGYSITTPLGSVKSPRPGPIYATIFLTAMGVSLALILGYLHHAHIINAVPRAIGTAGDEAEDILIATRLPPESLSRAERETRKEDHSEHVPPEAPAKPSESLSSGPGSFPWVLGLRLTWRLLAESVSSAQMSD